MFQNYTFHLCAIAVLLTVTQVTSEALIHCGMCVDWVDWKVIILCLAFQMVTVYSNFALDIIVEDYLISTQTRDGGSCCTCSCFLDACGCAFGCCTTETCQTRQAEIVVYAHLGGCQAGGCDMWGRYQVPLENDLQITIEGSGDLSECPANVCEKN